MRTLLLLPIALLASPVWAADFTITIQNHQFSPAELTVPAGQKIKLLIKNLDEAPAEFESSDLNREKVVSAHGEITTYLGPLDPGRYSYFDDFHPDTQGTINAQ